VRLPVIVVVGVFAVVALVLIASALTRRVITPPPSANIPAGYQFVFGDEFDGDGLDSSEWEYRYPNRQYLAGFTDDASVDQPGDGYLHLVTRFDESKFLVGMIQSRDTFRYGYFEARIRFHRLQGHHGAFWLQSPLHGQFPDDPGRSGAEIDIIEFLGNGRTQADAQHNIYWNPYDSPQRQHRQHNLHIRRNSGAELSDDFHLFALLWTENEYLFFVDGVETWRSNEGISHVPQHIVLSLVTAEWENQRLDASLLPDEMLIDYVRVYTPS
jgi:beta-glucanase (GH16 family)